MEMTRYVRRQEVWAFLPRLGWVAGEIERVHVPDHHGAVRYEVRACDHTWTVTEDKLEPRR